jgi:hypothetical protein
MKIIIQTMANNEPHISEWIVHHILLNFDHIYIYDDNSIIPIQDVVNNLDEYFRSRVTVYRLDNSYEFYNKNINFDVTSLKYYDEKIFNEYKNYKQFYLLNYFLKYHKTVAEYCFFTDADEFIYLKDLNNIKDFIKKYYNYDMIYINWIYYGTSFHINDPKGLVIDNYRLHNRTYSDCGKSIVRLSKLKFINNIHEILGGESYFHLTEENRKYLENNKFNINKFDYNQPLHTLPIHINHYITFNLKHYISKKMRYGLGQTNMFNRDMNGIIRCTIGKSLCYKDIHIMEKYVKNVYKYTYGNEDIIGNYITYDNYEKYTGDVYFEGNIINENNYSSYANKHDLEKIVNSNNIYYITQ